ncbi:MAG: hypothetical protein AAGM38_16935, partial [Pseudomonadota bacterium]
RLEILPGGAALKSALLREEAPARVTATLERLARRFEDEGAAWSAAEVERKTDDAAADEAGALKKRRGGGAEAGGIAA